MPIKHQLDSTVTEPERSIWAHFSRRVDPKKTHVAADLRGKDVDGLAASPPSAAVLERRTPTVMKMGWDSLAVMVLFAGGLVLLYAVE
jgi:hypothetical protein